ncbi:MAG: lytic transglycosylase domain-containing protein [Rhodospirillaceae bacterium]
MLALRGKWGGRVIAATVAAMVLSAAGPGVAGSLSASDLDLYRAAFRHAENERWDEAVRIASEGSERLPGKIMRWLDLARPQSGNSFAAISGFLRANKLWPNRAGLQRQAEKTMPDDMPAGEVRAWFAQFPPASSVGVGRYHDALIAGGERDKATELVRKFWVDSNFSNTEDELDFRQRFASELRSGDHAARLERLLWEHQPSAAQRMLSRVDENRQALAKARLALADDEPGLDAAVQRIPESLRSDPGFLYERLRWRRRKDNDAGALEILHAPPEELGRPALWWAERHILARRLMERRDYAGAYRLVKQHGQSEGTALGEAEFLAGWLALRRLNKPAEAYAHFQRMYTGANSPMSRSRGAYWSGRAAEAQNDKDQAREWYGIGAKYPTMFYGQLAAAALGQDRVSPGGEPSVSSAEQSEFNRRELVRVVHLLREIDPRDATDRIGLFMRRLTKDATTPADYVLLGRLAQEVHRPDLAIFVSKQAFQAGTALPVAGYPAVPVHSNGEVEAALVLALIRQESTFNTNTVSSAGARGLMQLMPATAKLVAGKLGVRHVDARLTADTDYNILLGSTFIGQMIDVYSGSYILAIAAYNAGSGRVTDWLAKFGDPRDDVDPLDWIESIPIGETRNYVQRILEALQVYRTRLGTASGDHSLKRDLKR